MDMVDRTKTIIALLILIIVVLAGIVVYTLAIRPAVTGYTTNAQQQGVDFAILSIMQRAALCQTVPLTSGNTTINLIAIECLQQAQQQQTEIRESGQ